MRTLFTAPSHPAYDDECRCGRALHHETEKAARECDECSALRLAEPVQLSAVTQALRVASIAMLDRAYLAEPTWTSRSDELLAQLMRLPAQPRALGGAVSSAHHVPVRGVVGFICESLAVAS